MGDDDELTILIDNHEGVKETVQGIFGEENYGRVQYDDEGNEYHLVLIVQRRQMKHKGE